MLAALSREAKRQVNGICAQVAVCGRGTGGFHLHPLRHVYADQQVVGNSLVKTFQCFLHCDLDGGCILFDRDGDGAVDDRPPAHIRQACRPRCSRWRELLPHATIGGPPRSSLAPTISGEV